MCLGLRPLLVGLGDGVSVGTGGICRQLPISHIDPHSMSYGCFGVHQDPSCVFCCATESSICLLNPSIHFGLPLRLPCGFLHTAGTCVCLAVCHKVFCLAFSPGLRVFDVLQGHVFFPSPSPFLCLWRPPFPCHSLVWGFVFLLYSRTLCCLLFSCVPLIQHLFPFQAPLGLSHQLSATCSQELGHTSATLVAPAVPDGTNGTGPVFPMGYSCGPWGRCYRLQLKVGRRAVLLTAAMLEGICAARGWPHCGRAGTTQPLPNITSWDRDCGWNCQEGEYEWGWGSHVCRGIPGKVTDGGGS